jgi:hypothetical protein
LKGTIVTRVNTINKIICLLRRYSLLLSIVFLVGIVLLGTANAQERSGVQECAVQTTTQEATAFFATDDGATFTSPSNTVQITTTLSQQITDCACMTLASTAQFFNDASEQVLPIVTLPQQHIDEGGTHLVVEPTGLCRP